jgi:hypothetical protein
VDRDPVALLIWLYLETDWRVASTPAELFKGEFHGVDRVEEIPGGWPSTPQEMREHLERVAPALQGERLPYSGSTHENRRISVQYWEKDGAGEGLWVFVSSSGDGPNDYDMEYTVWNRVRRIERIGEKAFEKMPPELRPLRIW